MSQENNKNGIDLSKRLNESTVKSVKSQKEQWFSGTYVSPTAPKIIRWLIKYSGGLIKNEKQASYFILGFIVLAVIISFLLIFSGGGGSSREDLENFSPPAEAPESF